MHCEEWEILKYILKILKILKTLSALLLNWFYGFNGINGFMDTGVIKVWIQSVFIAQDNLADWGSRTRDPLTRR